MEAGSAGIRLCCAKKAGTGKIMSQNRVLRPCRFFMGLGQFTRISRFPRLRAAARDTNGILRASVRELRELLTDDSEHVPLDIAALQLASIEYPEVSVDAFLLLLDSHAREVQERISEDTPGPEFIRILNEYLFQELGFRGNSDDYYNPSNS